MRNNNLCILICHYILVLSKTCEAYQHTHSPAENRWKTAENAPQTNMRNALLRGDRQVPTGVNKRAELGKKLASASHPADPVAGHVTHFRTCHLQQEHVGFCSGCRYSALEYVDSVVRIFCTVVGFSIFNSSLDKIPNRHIKQIGLYMYKNIGCDL